MPKIVVLEVSAGLDVRDLRILGVIPARGGSKRIPGKNLRPIHGRPLIQYTFDAAKQSDLLERVILSTDDEAIADFGRSQGIEVPFTRPVELSTADASMPPVAIHALDWMAVHSDESYDAVAVLQPTSPLRQANDIDEGLTAFKEGEMDALIAVCELRESPFDTVCEEPGEYLRYLIPKDQRKDHPKCSFLSGAFYVVLSNVLRSELTLFPAHTAAYTTDWTSSIDVDTEIDWQIAEYLLWKRSEIAQ